MLRNRFASFTDSDQHHFAFDLLKLDGTDMRREPIEVRKATLASILRKSRHGVRLNDHLEYPDGALVFAHACVQAARVALPFRSLAGLAEVQEPGRTCDEARSRGGLALMPHPEWIAMSSEQKMEFLYNWCFQMSEVVQELRATTQTLMDKVILVEAMLAERHLPPAE